MRTSLHRRELLIPLALNWGRTLHMDQCKSDWIYKWHIQGCRQGGARAPQFSCNNMLCSACVLSKCLLHYSVCLVILRTWLNMHQLRQFNSYTIIHMHFTHNLFLLLWSDAIKNMIVLRKITVDGFTIPGMFLASSPPPHFSPQLRDKIWAEAWERG